MASIKHTIPELLLAIRRLPTVAPQSETLHKSGYDSHKAHWMGWLGEYDGPGYYGRSSWDVDARSVYQRLNCGQMIVWLNEAAGAPARTVAQAITQIQWQGGGNAAREAKIARSFFPWEQTAMLLFKRH